MYGTGMVWTGQKMQGSYKMSKLGANEIYISKLAVITNDDLF